MTKFIHPLIVSIFLLAVSIFNFFAILLGKWVYLLGNRSILFGKKNRNSTKGWFLSVQSDKTKNIKHVVFIASRKPHTYLIRELTRKKVIWLQLLHKYDFSASGRNESNCLLILESCGFKENTSLGHWNAQDPVLLISQKPLNFIRTFLHDLNKWVQVNWKKLSVNYGLNWIDLNKS